MRTNFGVVLKQLRLNILLLLWSKAFTIKAKNSCFVNREGKCNVSMHSDIQRPISLKLVVW